MNQVVKTIMNHRSIRSYKKDPIPEAVLTAIYNGIQAAPSSINGQQLSVIVIEDSTKKTAIAELCGGQPWISEAPVFLLFVADYHRAQIAALMNNEPLAITDSLESIMVSSVDIGLAMGNAIAVAESYELGIVPIGAVRKEPQAFIDMLNLPDLVFPVAGLVIGYPKDMSAKKPRFPQEAIIHCESYDRQQASYVESYDQIMSAYLQERTNGKSKRSWSETTAGFYRTVYFPKVYPTIKSQGFSNDR